MNMKNLMRNVIMLFVLATLNSINGWAQTANDNSTKFVVPGVAYRLQHTQSDAGVYLSTVQVTPKEPTISLQKNTRKSETFYFEEVAGYEGSGFYSLKDGDGNYIYLYLTGNRNWQVLTTTTPPAESGKDIRCFLFRVAEHGSDGMVLQNYYNADASKTVLKDYLGTNKDKKNEGTPVYTDKIKSECFSFWKLMTTTAKDKLKVEIVSAEMLLSVTPEGTTHYQVPAADREAYQTAVNAAQAVLDNSSATTKQIDDAITDLDEATATFRSKFGTFTVHESELYTLVNRNKNMLTFTADNSNAMVARPNGVGGPSDKQYIRFEDAGNNTYYLYYEDTENAKHYLYASNNDAKWGTSKTAFSFARVDGSCCFYTLTGSNRILGSIFGENSNVTTRTTNNNDNDISLSHWLLTLAGTVYNFHIVNKSGTESIYKGCVISDESVAIAVPDVLKSPGASAYHYYPNLEDAVAGTNEYKNKTFNDLGDSRDIYVTYEVDESKFKMNDNDVAYFLNVDGVYLKNASDGTLTYDATAVTNPANYTDEYKWKLTATDGTSAINDPYNCSFELFSSSGKKLTVKASDLEATSNTVALSTESGTGYIDKWIILQGAEGHYRLIPVHPCDKRFAIYNSGGTLKLKSSSYMTTMLDADLQAQVAPIIGVTYTIVKNNGEEFCTVTGNAPGRPDLPDYMKSPLATNYRYYTTLADAKKDAEGKEVTPYPDWAVSGGHYYVRYDFNAANDALGTGEPMRLNGTATYLMSGYPNKTNYYGFNYMRAQFGSSNWEAAAKQNNCRVAWVSGSGNKDNAESHWVFYGEDPYSITIRNKGMMDEFTDARYFLGPVVNDDNQGHVYMYNDADRNLTTSTWALLNNNCLIATYYNDKTRFRYFDDRESMSTKVELFSTGSMPASAPVTIELKGALNSYTYHIIDKQGYEAVSSIGTTLELQVPFSIRSPLVQTYHFYDVSDFTTTTVDGQTKYTLNSGATELTEQQTDIYVTYDVNPAYKLSNSRYANNKPYGGMEFVLQYTNAPYEIDQEVSDYPNFGKYKPAYPYVNGNGGFYLFGSKKYDGAIDTGNSTGSRYQINFVSNGNEDDPYDVKIVFPKNFDKASQHYDATNPDNNNLKYYSWFCTYDDSEQGVVTTLTQEDRSRLEYTDATYETKAQYAPSRYMLIGATTKAVSLYTRETFNGEHLLIDKYQHMWKSEYDHPASDGSTVKKAVEAKGVSLHTLDIDKDWFRKTNPRLLVGREVTYNQKNDNLTETTGTGTIKPLTTDTGDALDNEKLCHWFQTVDMGAVFEINKTAAPPILYLLDNHRWIIHQQRLTSSSSERLRRLNSPLVKKYHWYKLNANQVNAAKITDYYKYNFNTNTTEANSLYVGSTTDLADWQHVDFDAADAATTTYFVTYEVEDVYKSGYDPTTNKIIPNVLFEENTSLVTPTPATDGNTIVMGTSSNDYYDQEEAAVVMANMLKGNPEPEMLWQIRRNTNIDEECGWKYGEDDKSKTSVEDSYTANGQNDFDPYNIQVVSQKRVDDNNPARFLTLPYTGTPVAAVIQENGDMTLTEGARIIATPQTQTPGILEQRTGTTFMYVEGNDNYGEMVSRFNPDYALRKKDGKLIVYKKDANNDDARARFTPVTPYKLYIKQRGSSTWDLDGLDVYAVTGHEIVFKKYHRSLCDYKFYSDASGEEQYRIYVNPVNGGGIYAIYDVQGAKFFSSVAELRASTDPAAWNFLQMGVGFQEKRRITTPPTWVSTSD